MQELRVAESAELAGRGLAIFFERDPEPVPAELRLQVRIVLPDGTIRHFEAYREFALKRPLGDVVAFVLPAARRADVPVGSLVSILVVGRGLRI